MKWPEKTVSRNDSALNSKSSCIHDFTAYISLRYAQCSADSFLLNSTQDTARTSLFIYNYGLQPTDNIGSHGLSPCRPRPPIYYFHSATPLPIHIHSIRSILLYIFGLAPQFFDYNL